MTPSDVARLRPADSSQQFSEKTIRVLALMEALSVTGPAKNLIEFASRCLNDKASNPKIHLSIATFHRTGKKNDAFVEAVKNAGLEIDIIEERSPLDVAIVRHLRNILETRKPDIIQSHNFKSHFLIKFLGLHRERRWLAFHHGHTWTDLKNRVYNQVDRWSLPGAQQIITVCGAFASELQGYGIPPGRIKVLHNSVKPFSPSSPDEALAVRESLRIPKETLVLLSVGRLSREKGHLDLINAVKSIVDKNPALQFRILIVGDGHEKTKLQTLTEQLRVSEHVIFAGHQANLIPFYTVADIFVLPSHSEGSPNALLEAMAAGLPSVATRVGGVPEIAQDEKTAFLVPPNDPQALSSSMTTLLRDGATRHAFGEYARQEARKYSPDEYYRRLVSLYKDLTRN